MMNDRVPEQEAEEDCVQNFRSLRIPVHEDPVGFRKPWIHHVWVVWVAPGLRGLPTRFCRDNKAFWGTGHHGVLQRPVELLLGGNTGVLRYGNPLARQCNILQIWTSGDGNLDQTPAR